MLKCNIRLHLKVAVQTVKKWPFAMVWYVMVWYARITVYVCPDIQCSWSQTVSSQSR